MRDCLLDKQCSVQYSIQMCTQRRDLLVLTTDGKTVRNISNTRDSVSSGYPNIEKRVENMTCSGVFLTKYEVLG